MWKQPSAKHGCRRTTATCVQRFDDSQILQFTLLIALCYVLHRYTSQEIHRWQLCILFLFFGPRAEARNRFTEASIVKLDVYKIHWKSTLAVIKNNCKEASPTEPFKTTFSQLMSIPVLKLSPKNRKQTQTEMILPQVHLRKPCYDFYFL